jgi:hypothetical protein
VQSANGYTPRPIFAGLAAKEQGKVKRPAFNFAYSRVKRQGSGERDHQPLHMQQVRIEALA